jgi:hypothetical protein
MIILKIYLEPIFARLPGSENEGGSLGGGIKETRSHLGLT